MVGLRHYAAWASRAFFFGVFGVVFGTRGRAVARVLYNASEPTKFDGFAPDHSERGDTQTAGAETAERHLERHLQMIGE